MALKSTLVRFLQLLNIPSMSWTLSPLKDTKLLLAPTNDVSAANIFLIEIMPDVLKYWTLFKLFKLTMSLNISHPVGSVMSLNVLSK